MCSLKKPTQSSAAPTPSAAGGAATGSAGNASTDDIVAMTWYTGWHSQYLPVDQISWDKYTAVTFSFAVTTEDVNTVSLNDSDSTGQLVPALVAAAHSHNSKAMITVGGWTGSQYFSTAVATAENRTAFTKTMMNLVQQYDLDGVDFDWEYPGKQGAGCNQVNSADTANFLLFLQELRTQAPNITLSAASSIVPFAGPDGQPSADVSEFAKVLDYVEIMDYDVWGTWSDAVGPNSPLDDTCSPSPQGSAVSAVKAWTGAGFPASQLVLGMAAYGHSFEVTQSDAFANSGNMTASSVVSTTEAAPAGTTPIALYPQFNKAVQPFGDPWDEDAAPGVDQCGNPTAGGPSGIFNFAGMIEQGILDQNGTVVGGQGFGFRYDACSQTPFVYIPQNQTMISYDDPTSFAAKGEFIREQGLRGFAVWEAAGDYNDLLVDAVSNAIGIEE